ncbi:MAG: SDR family oxidoreductase [Anaerolineae bacterium]|nr:SDR family oxidoreductase [Anaerolineae bacterium]
MKNSLTDQVALVTGSAHRVGKVIALALAAAGTNIVIHYHGAEDDAQTAVREAKSFGVDAIRVQADQSDPQQVNALFDAVREHYGRLDILVNSANLYRKIDFFALSYDDWQRVLAVNLTGPFLCCQAAARLMQAQDPPGGVIVNILDNSAFHPWAGFPQHGVAKAGLLNLTQTLARRLAPGIRVNAVVPGPVLKEPGRSDESWQQLGERLPLRRTGTPEAVGRAVVYLASEGFLTGTILHVDGGESLVQSGGSPTAPAT